MRSEAGLRDPLTDALARSSFQGVLERESARAQETGAPLGLIILDLDHFKSINDAFGHARGDQVLAEFGRRINEMVREDDLVFRFGGDEFVLVLPGLTRAQAAGLARRVLERVRSHPYPGDPPVAGSLSMGVASIPEDARTSAGLFEAADRRLLEAKRAGRGRVVAADPAAVPKVVQPPVSRLLDRDRELEVLHRFLRDLPFTGKGALVLRGEPGAGRSRLLDELRHVAELYALRIATVRGRPALRTRSFGAMMEAVGDFGGVVPIPGAEIETELADLLHATGKSGLLLVVDDLGQLDEDSLAAIRRIVASPLLPVVGLACSLAPGEALEELVPESPLPKTVDVGGIGRDGLRGLVRILARREPTEPALDWLMQCTGGLPGRVAGILRALAADGYPGVEQWDPARAPDETWMAERVAAMQRAEPLRLPEFAGPIIGRDREIEQGRRLLAAKRLVTILGPGGIGKTRLAAQLASEVAGTFPDGVWFVPLGAVHGSEFLPAAIGEAIGAPLSGSMNPRRQLIDFLRARSALLVLDQVEHIEDAHELVLQLLRDAPRLRILATSRQRLHMRDEVLLELGGLAAPRESSSRHLGSFPAIRLLLRSARTAAPDFAMDVANRGAIVRICRLLEGAPLALEIAGAHLRVLDPDELERQIERGLEVLEFPLSDVPERHRPLRTVLEVVWRTLSAGDRGALLRLAAFPDGATVAAADAIDVSAQRLDSLAGRALLRRTDARGPRYALPGAVRSFLTQPPHADAAIREEAEHRIASWFAHLVAESAEPLTGARHTEAAARLAAEIAGVRFAWRRAVNREDAAMQSEMLEGLYRYYDRRSQYLEAQDLIGVAADRLPHDSRLAGRILVRHAHFCVRLSRLVAARRYLERAATLLPADPADPENAMLTRVQAEVSRSRGRYRAAWRLFTRAMHGFEAAGMSFDVAACLQEIGLVAWSRGDAAAARAHLESCLAIRRDVGDLQGISRCLTHLGILADGFGEADRARELIGESVEVARLLGDRRELAQNLFNLGAFHLFRSRRLGGAAEMEEATRALTDALRLFRAIGDRNGAANACCAVAEALLIGEEPSAAAAHVHEALLIASELGAAPIQVRALATAVQLFARAGDIPTALHLLESIRQHPAAEAGDVSRAEAVVQGAVHSTGLLATPRTGVALPRGVPDLVEHLVTQTLPTV